MDSLSSKEAKQEYFLTAKDLKSLPRETLYLGFACGRATWLFDPSDLEAAAIAKYGKETFAKKLAARQKRENNKRKREAAAEAAEAEQEKRRQAAIAANPVLAKQETTKKQKQGTLLRRNKEIVGPHWGLTMLSPERVAGTEASLFIGSFQLCGLPGEAQISCDDLKSPAYSFGNIHGFKGNSSEQDETMIFETKWKLMGERFTGTLAVKVLPDDRVKDGAAAKNKTEESDASKENEHPKEEKESLMVTGWFDCGVDDGVRQWTFKGYK